ncbi:Uncharacterised protein [Vibrio cholerae]|nr:Uncharacterised protein [Vibrio cholerae]
MVTIHAQQVVKLITQQTNQLLIAAGLNNSVVEIEITLLVKVRSTFDLIDMGRMCRQ